VVLVLVEVVEGVVAVIVVLIVPTAAIVKKVFISCYTKICCFIILRYKMKILSFAQMYWIILEVYRSNTVLLFQISILVYSGGTV
jgi:hypothetical protein